MNFKASVSVKLRWGWCWAWSCIQWGFIPPIPKNLQLQAAHSLKTRPFIQPPPPSTPLMPVTSDRPSTILQDASSAFRDRIYLPQCQRTSNQRLPTCTGPVHIFSPLHFQHLQWLLHQTTPVEFCKVPVLHLEMALFARLLTVLEEIKETQRVHGRMIQSLLTQQDARAVAALPEDIVFPLRTVSDITAMEQKLSDPTFQKQVVCSNMTNLAGSQVLMLMFFHIQYCAKVFGHHQLCC